MNPDKIWDRFVLLLSLDLHDGNVVDALKRPAKNLHGSVESHKKIFDQAVAEVAAEENEMTVALMDGEFDVGGEG